MEVFWAMTPKEFHFVFEAWQDSRNYLMETSWEQTRLLAYYHYCAIPKKKNNPSYHEFKLKHLPFSWDIISNEDLDEELTEQPIKPDEWAERISRMKTVKSLSNPQNI